MARLPTTELFRLLLHHRTPFVRTLSQRGTRPRTCQGVPKIVYWTRRYEIKIGVQIHLKQQPNQTRQIAVTKLTDCEVPVVRTRAQNLPRRTQKSVRHKTRSAGADIQKLASKRLIGLNLKQQPNQNRQIAVENSLTALRTRAQNLPRRTQKSVRPKTRSAGADNIHNPVREQLSST